MPTTGSSRAPKQQRSRQTLERLLAATIKVLDEQGLAGAVVPNIASLAKVSPASIYRRFKDKDDLLRSAFLYLLRRSNETNRQRLQSMLLRDTLEATAARLMDMLFDQYQQHPRLLRALSRFMDADADTDFAREARLHVAENVNQIAKIMLAFRKEIAHRSPRRALQFALLSAVSSIETFVLEPLSLWHSVLPLSGNALKAELARAFVAYLRNA